MKGLWVKFTTRFAVPMLMFSQIVTLYDGWESRTVAREYEMVLKRCIVGHSHSEQVNESVVSVDGEIIQWSEDSYVILPSGCDSLNPINDLAQSFTPQRTMDRWLGKVFSTYKINKDKFKAWYEDKFQEKMLEDIRG
jgi:hypothetical protein